MYLFIQFLLNPNQNLTDQKNFAILINKYTKPCGGFTFPHTQNIVDYNSNSQFFSSFFFIFFPNFSFFFFRFFFLFFAKLFFFNFFIFSYFFIYFFFKIIFVDFTF